VWKTACVNITYLSADCRHTWPKISITSVRTFADFTFRILKCREGPSFIHLVISAMFISTYSYVSFSSKSFFACSACATLWSVNIYWAVNLNFLWELLSKLSRFLAAFSNLVNANKLSVGMLREICESLGLNVDYIKQRRKSHWESEYPRLSECVGAHESDSSLIEQLRRQNKRTLWCFRSTTLCLFKHQ